MMTQRSRYTAIAFAVAGVTVVVLPFHIAVMEWILTQGDLVLTFCGQLLGGAWSPGQAPSP